ncbi:MAG: glycoside hydrolase family 10 protein [Tepidisphaerales bacterium]
MRAEWRRWSAGLCGLVMVTAALVATGGCRATGSGSGDASAAPHGGDQRGSPLALSRADVRPPAIAREFRGVWVASVVNINWPSRPGLSTAQQQAELLHILDRAAELNFNAVLLQVRPTADALYASELEPWSYYLTGTQGKAPEPFYDPLALAVAEAHKRGLELHAWINPFRVRQKGARYPASADSLSRRHPEWVRQYGTLEWLDPGEPAAREHSLKVAADLVTRYDIDGIHIDDYFYPYRERGPDGKEMEFPDAETYAKYGQGRSLGDFRRANINDYVRRLYEQTKRIKPHVKVGISPFGIWRPGHPPQVRGMDAYEVIYGDALLWLREGWSDYFTPQLYWPIAQTPQSFPVLLNWWIGENVQGRHLWPGLFTTRADGARPTWPASEVEYQVKISRGLGGPGGAGAVGGGTGQVHFSASFLTSWTAEKPNPLAMHLKDTVYGSGAAVPESLWLSGGGTWLAEVSGVEVRPGRKDGVGEGWWVSAVLPAGSVRAVVQWAAAAEGGGGAGAAGAGGWRQMLLGRDGTGRGELFIPANAARLELLALTPLDRAGRAGQTVVLRVGGDEGASAAVAAVGERRAATP